MTKPLEVQRIVIVNGSGWHEGYRAIIDEPSSSIEGDVIQGTFKFLPKGAQFLCVFYTFYGEEFFSSWGDVPYIEKAFSDFFHHPIAFAFPT
jgi:hypothetical protein